MDLKEQTIEDYKTSWKLEELERTIQYAKLRCLSADELMDCISEIDLESDTSALVNRLLEIQLNVEEIDRLVNLIRTLAAHSESAPSKLKAKIDRTLLRLVRQLPDKAAVKIASPYVNHQRKARRQWAYSALRGKTITQDMAVLLFKGFQTHQDQESLELIARNPQVIPIIGADEILEILDDDYWRARVIEGMLVFDRGKALAIASKYPFQFSHAAGRSGDTSLIPILRELFEENLENLEFLSIYAYALGKLHALGELQSLEHHIATTYEEYVLNRETMT